MSINNITELFAGSGKNQSTNPSKVDKELFASHLSPSKGSLNTVSSISHIGVGSDSQNVKNHNSLSSKQESSIIHNKPDRASINGNNTQSKYYNRYDRSANDNSQNSNTASSSAVKLSQSQNNVTEFHSTSNDASQETSLDNSLIDTLETRDFNVNVSSYLSEVSNQNGAQVEVINKAGKVSDCDERILAESTEETLPGMKTEMYSFRDSNAQVKHDFVDHMNQEIINSLDDNAQILDDRSIVLVDGDRSVQDDDISTREEETKTDDKDIGANNSNNMAVNIDLHTEVIREEETKTDDKDIASNDLNNMAVNIDLQTKEENLRNNLEARASYNAQTSIDVNIDHTNQKLGTPVTKMEYDNFSNNSADLLKNSEYFNIESGEFYIESGESNSLLLKKSFNDKNNSGKKVVAGDSNSPEVSAFETSGSMERNFNSSNQGQFKNEGTLGFEEFGNLDSANEIRENYEIVENKDFTAHIKVNDLANVAKIKFASISDNTNPVIPLQDQISMTIEKAAAEGVGKIQVALYPESLGKLDIEFNIENEIITSIKFIAQKQETLDSIKADRILLEQIVRDVTKGGDASLSFSLGNYGQQHREPANQEADRTYVQNNKYQAMISVDSLSQENTISENSVNLRI